MKKSFMRLLNQTNPGDVWTGHLCFSDWNRPTENITAEVVQCSKKGIELYISGTRVITVTLTGVFDIADYFIVICDGPSDEPESNCFFKLKDEYVGAPLTSPGESSKHEKNYNTMFTHK